MTQQETYSSTGFEGLAAIPMRRPAVQLTTFTRLSES